MKTLNIEITGLSPLLMNTAKYLGVRTSTSVTKSYKPEEEAEKSAYWTTKGKKELMIPSEVIYACILNASSFHKINKRSAKSVMAGSIRIEPSEIRLGTSDYEIDTRSVVIQRNRVLKSRAKLENWKAKFQIVYDDRTITDSIIIKTIMEEAGRRIGLMDFRPQKAGWFGTFQITKFEEVEEKVK